MKLQMLKKKSRWDSVKQKKIANRHVIFCYEIYFWLFKLQKSHYENSSFWGFPWNPVVKTLCFQFRGAGSIPGQGTEIPHVMQKWQKKKKKEERKIFVSDTSIWPTELSWKYSVKLL